MVIKVRQAMTLSKKKSSRNSHSLKTLGSFFRARSVLQLAKTFFRTRSVLQLPTAMSSMRITMVFNKT